MKQLSTLQLIIYQLGGIIMVAGAVIAATSWGLLGTILYTLGVAGWTSMQLMCTYSGHNLTLKRLRRQQVLGAVLLIASAVLLCLDYLGIYTLLRTGSWKMLFLIATVFQVYTAFRIPAAWRKEQDKTQQHGN